MYSLNVNPQTMIHLKVYFGHFEAKNEVFYPQFAPGKRQDSPS